MLHISGLSTGYTDGKGTRVQAVRDVGFDVPEGKLFTLLGPSGCGKTTTLRSIAGLERPESGTILVDGTTVFSSSENVFVPPNQRRFGMVFQSYAIWPHMTVFGNTAFPLEVGRVRLSRRDIEAKVMRALQAVGLEAMADRDATRMSGGQQQRLALARALVMEPRLLLLDEPLSNLDAKLREKMRFEVKRLQRELKITTVYVTHDQEEALALSHEIAVMHEGRIVQLAAPRQMYDAPNCRFVADFVGSTNFLDGAIRFHDRDASRMVVESAIGPLSVDTREPHTAGDRVVISVRPENLLLFAERPDDEGANVFEGVVHSKVFLGQTLDLQIQVGRELLRVRAHPSQNPSLGSTVFVAVDPMNCLALEPA